MKRTLFPLVFLSALTLPSYGAAISGTSFAYDLSASATVTGGLVVPIADVSVTAGPVNEASGTSPTPYASNPTLVSADAATSGLATLDLAADADVDSLLAASDIDGLAGNRFVSAAGELNSTSANLALNLGILGNVDVITVTTTSTEALVSASGVEWDGSLLTPSAASNFLSSGTTVTLLVLGVSVPVGVLAPNVETVIDIDLSNTFLGSILSATGEIRITADGFTLTGASPLTASGSATALRVDADLALSSLGLVDLDVQNEIIINETSATASAVPEPGASLLALLAGLSVVGIRRR